MPRGGVNCKFAKEWNCTLKPRKFLFWKWFETCVHISDDKKCDDQIRYVGSPPKSPSLQSAKKRCDCCYCKSKLNWGVSPSKSVPPSKPNN